MFTISIKKLWKRRYYIHHKNNKKNNGNEKHPKKDESKVTYDFLWNKFVQKFPQNNKVIIEYPHCRAVLI